MEVIPRGDAPLFSAVVSRGDAPPYSPMSMRTGLIAKTAMASGWPAPTMSPPWVDPSFLRKSPLWDDDPLCLRKSRLWDEPPYPGCRGAWRLLVRVARACAVTDSLGACDMAVISREDDPPYLLAFAVARVRSQKARWYRVRFAAAHDQGGATWLR